MPRYVLHRLLAFLPTLVLASIIVFGTVRLVPGDVIDLMLSQNDISADRLSREQLIEQLGMNRPVWEQYIHWISDIVLHGDWGRSLWQDVAVSEQLLMRFPVTLGLGLLALLIAVIIAIPIGIYSALRQDTLGDYMARSAAVLMLAVPGFWIGTMVMVFPSIWWGWSAQVDHVSLFQGPLQGVRELFLPALVLGMAMAGIIMRMMRTMMLEVMELDYIRTAWAKGLNARAVILRHALRNALIPVITLIGMQTPLLISGAVIVEQIFVIPGIGTLLLDAVTQRDYPVISGVFLMAGVCVLTVNLIVDISYGLLDPRIAQR